MQRILVVGATSLIAEHCLRVWAARPVHFVLAARDPAKLDRIARDLRVRSHVSVVETHAPSFDDGARIGAFVDEVWSKGAIDIALIAHGSLPDQAACQDAIELAKEALELNGISPVLFAEALAQHMQQAGRGTIALIGSVAGDRGRRSNYVYGAAKGLLDRYAQGLRHRFAGSGARAIIVKPGPTATPMTTGLAPTAFGFADPARVARDIVRGIDAGRPVIYTPWFWRWVMLVIVHIPERIFGKVDL